eukprot:tig00000615_g2555.t1
MAKLTRSLREWLNVDGSVLADIAEVLMKMRVTELRQHQRDPVKAQLEGKDVLMITATGSGKSLIFQLVALASPGVTIVVSPYIALMENQVNGLKAKGFPVEFWHSGLNEDDKKRINNDLKSERPQTKLLYCAPEKIFYTSPNGRQFFLETLKGLAARGALPRFVIDEAHEIKNALDTGFRAEAFGQLSRLRAEMPSAGVVALTATATKETQERLIEFLGLGEGRPREVFRFTSDRPELKYKVVHKDRWCECERDPRTGELRHERDCEGVIKAAVFEDILAFCTGPYRAEASGIVFCTRKDTCEELAAHLRRGGLAAATYHADFSKEQRSRVQRDWEGNRTRVVVATTAFGTGIDKSDVRFVVQYDIPKTLEALHQQSGRAGRDRERSDYRIYFDWRDVERMEFCIDPKDATGNSVRKDRAVVNAELGELQKVAEFCATGGCRRALLLAHFGDDAPACHGACCDNWAPSPSSPSASSGADPAER